MWRRSDEEAQDAPSHLPAPTPPQPRTPRRAGQSSVLGPSLKLEGRLSGEEDLIIEGHVSGEISIPGHQVTIGPEGHVEAEVRATAIVVEGEVHGNLSAEQQVMVRASGKVHGDIRAPRVALDQGCRFKGTVDMEPSRREGAAKAEPAKPAAGPSPTGSSRSGEAKTEATAARTPGIPGPAGTH